MRRRTIRQREWIVAACFLAPSLLGFLVFVAGPVIGSTGLAFYDWDLFNSPEFVGTANLEALLSDPLLARTLLNTGFFAAGSLAVNVGLGVMVAVAINWLAWPRFGGIIRTAFFLPFVMSTAVVAVLWSTFFQRDTGVINWALGLIGIDPIPWLSSSAWAWPSLFLIEGWKSTGFYVIILLAALQAIPKEYYEAVKVDGGSAWTSFRHITLPLLSPSVLLCSVISIIGSSQAFDTMFVLTGGGPGDTTRTVVMYLYQQGFSSFRMGYASAIALVLFAIVLIFTAIQFRLSRRWVHYQ